MFVQAEAGEGLCSSGNSAQDERRPLFPRASLCSVTLRIAETSRGQRLLLQEAFQVNGDVQRGASSVCCRVRASRHTFST